MTAYSVVRFRVNPGQESEFEAIYASLPRNFPGVRNIALIRDEFNNSEDGEDDGTKPTKYFAVGEWDSYDDIKDARPLMMQNRARFEHTLVNFGKGKGITDAVSGTAVYEARPSRG